VIPCILGVDAMVIEPYSENQNACCFWIMRAWMKLMGFSEIGENLPSEIFCRGSDCYWIIEVCHENRRAAIFFLENKCKFTLETTLEVNIYDTFKRDNQEA
jgi:hypothetical protein